MTIYTYENPVHLKELGATLFDEDLPDIYQVLNSSGAAIGTNVAVHVFNGTSSLEMRVADSSAAYDYPVSGFTKASVADGQKGDVRVIGQLKGFTGLTPTAKYYSNPATPGSICDISGITTTGQKEQLVGFAVDAVTLFIQPSEPIKRLVGANALKRQDGYLEETYVSAGADLIIAESTTPASPASGRQELFIDSADHHLKRVNSSGTVADIEVAAGNYTVDDSLTTTTSTGLLPNVLSWLGGMIKQITGKTHWYDAPDISLATTSTHVSSTSNPHATTAAQVGAVATGAFTTHQTASTIDHPDGSVTDAKIGNRTVDQTLATPGNTGSLLSLLSWMAGRIKAISGTTNWYDTPATTLAAANTHATSTSNPHSTTASQVGAVATVNTLTPSGTDFTISAGANITITPATHGISIASSSGITLPLTIANGGTGQITAVSALTALGGIAQVGGLSSAGGNIAVSGGKGISVSAAGTTITISRSSGTSFPGSPSTGDLYYRTDRNIEYFYDGTRWLSHKIVGSFATRGAMPFAQASQYAEFAVPDYAINGFYVESLQFSFFANSAQSGTNYYTLSGNTVNTSGAGSNFATTGDTKTLSTSSWRPVTVAVNTAYSSSYHLIEASAIPTNAPGTFYMAVSVAYRLIG